MDTKEPPWKKKHFPVVEIVQKSRAASAQGPNGLPYKVYNKRPMGHIAYLRKQFDSINTYDYLSVN